MDSPCVLDIRIATGSTSTTYTVSWPCGGEIDDPAGCDWHEMHHTDDEGNHWCPTGFMWCHNHGGIGTIDGPDTCQHWGEQPCP